VSDTGSVRDDREGGRFVLELDGEVAELDYDMEPGRLLLLHTGVPEALGGRGIGGQLVRAAVQRAAADGLTLVPWCPFARAWLEQHPDAVADVTVDWATPRPVQRMVRPAQQEGSDG
jgi:uncharacterized protein